MKSILQTWVMELGLRHQGVLLTAVRGCDTVHRDDPVKLIARALRGEMLEPHCGDITKSASFMHQYSSDQLLLLMEAFAKSFDHYPLHYVIHLIHAAEIVGYYHPTRADRWGQFYVRMCSKLHMTPETKTELDHRLGMDEKSFGLAQQ